MQDCTSLGSMCIDNCERLSHFSVDGLDTLTILEELTIRNCPSLTFIPIIPCLRGLVIEGCEKLSSLPSELKHCNALERLKITGSRNLQSIPISDVFPPSLRQFIIEDCAQLSSLPGRHKSLEELSIVNCPTLRWSSVADEGRSLTALRKLVIASSGGPKLSIRSISTLEEISLHDCTSLHNLEIVYCHKLISVADVDVTSLQSLSRLVIIDCEKLQYLPTGLHTSTRLEILGIGGLWKELDSFPVSKIPSSRTLVFCRWPNLKSWPHVIHHSTSPVTEFRIYGCDGLETLPEWLGDLTSLDRLCILNCKNLKSMPSAQAMQRLTNLKYIGIERCPFLKERCARGTGTEWPKISHIPNVSIYPP